MEKSNESRVPKEHLRKYFAQFFLSNPYVDLITKERTVHVFQDKLELHHIVPLGSIKKIGEMTKELRNDKNNMINSPLNFVYITEETNKHILEKSLIEYEKALLPEAISALFIVNYPKVEDLNDTEKLKFWLTERHKLLEGKIKEKVSGLLC